MDPLTASYYDPVERVWSGPKRKDLYNPDITLGEVILGVLSKIPDKIIQKDHYNEEDLTAAELLRYAEALSKNLLKIGLKVGDVIGLYVDNFPHTTTIMLSSFLCGTPVHTLYWDSDKETVSLMYKVTRPKIIFCEELNYERAKEVNAELKLNAPIYLVNSKAPKNLPNVKELLTFDDSLSNENFTYPCLDLKGDDTAVILCSSETTGTPKGVLCSHRALLNQIVFDDIKSDSVLLSFSSLYWASGLWTMVAALINGCLRIVSVTPYSPYYFLLLTSKYNVTHIIASVSEMIKLSRKVSDVIANIEECMESIETLLVVGSKVPLLVREKISKFLTYKKGRAGCVVAYGMSELSGILTYNSNYVAGHLDKSEGKITVNKVACIINKEGQRLGPTEHGEICILTPYTWNGYFNNEEATRKAQPDEWLHTGDIGFFDNDGFLHVCGRDNDVFKYEHFQIYPQLIENLIYRIPSVSEACVFGIPNFFSSNLPACAVVITSDLDELDLKETENEIADYVKANMESMYRLRGGVYVLDEMPKIAPGKVQRHKVLDLVMQLKDKE